MYSEQLDSIDPYNLCQSCLFAIITVRRYANSLEDRFAIDLTCPLSIGIGFYNQ